MPEFEKAQADLEAYQESRIPRILKQITVVMQDELKSLVLSSLDAYLALIRHYSTPKEEVEATSTQWVKNSVQISQPALLTVTLQLNEATVPDISDGSKPKEALCYDPPLETVVFALNSILEAFVTQTSGVPQIASRVMQMLGLPEETLATLSQNDAALKAARQELNEMLDASMVRPKQLLTLLKVMRSLSLLTRNLMAPETPSATEIRSCLPTAGL